MAALPACWPRQGRPSTRPLGAPCARRFRDRWPQKCHSSTRLRSPATGSETRARPNTVYLTGIARDVRASGEAAPQPTPDRGYEWQETASNEPVANQGVGATSRSRFVLTERGLPGFRAPTLRPNRPVSHGPDYFLVVEGPQVKGVLVTILPSSFLGARLLLRDAGVKVERPERSEDERP